MSTKATINPGLAGGSRSDSLDAHAERIYERPTPVLILAELVPVDRITPVDSTSEKDRIVRLRIEALEVACAGEQERILRDVLRLMYLSRTADGTLDADNEIQLAQQTLDLADGLVAAEQVASLVAILDWTIDRVGDVAADEKLRPADTRKALAQIRDRAAAARLGVHDKDGPRW